MDSTLPDSSYLFTRIAAGDEEAFRTVFHWFNARLHPFVLKVTRSSAAAEDIVQDTFLRLWLHRGEVARMHRPDAWIYKVASNLAFSYLRKQAAELRKLEKIETAHVEEKNALDELSVREWRERLSRAVDQLPPRRQYIYKLCREQGLSYKEVAEQLHISPHTVKNQLISALRTIKEQLGESKDII
ncbi:MAG TPA: RNA polymerase sigma-70 factor, partial [Candidatus Babeliaceae bacterium]|nr:RNA polymerase sigma-70 factor [Candidatus Babeliaceae bacterium]